MPLQRRCARLAACHDKLYRVLKLFVSVITVRFSIIGRAALVTRAYYLRLALDLRKDNGRAGGAGRCGSL